MQKEKLGGTLCENISESPRGNLFIKQRSFIVGNTVCLPCLN